MSVACRRRCRCPRSGLAAPPRRARMTSTPSTSVSRWAGSGRGCRRRRWCSRLMTTRAARVDVDRRLSGLAGRPGAARHGTATAGAARPHCIPTVSRWNSSMASRISRSVSRRRFSRCRRTEVRDERDDADVRTASTVIVMTSSMSVHPPEERRGRGEDGEKGGRDEICPLLPSSPLSLLPFSHRLPRRLRYCVTLKRPRRSCAADGAAVGGDEVHLVGVELEPASPGASPSTSMMSSSPSPVSGARRRRARPRRPARPTGQPTA